jgi:hypothetical protein
MSELYRILLRADEAESRTLPRAGVRERLRSVPKLVAKSTEHGDEHHEFGEADEHGVMTLTLRGPDRETLSAIEVEIPRPWVMDNGPQVFALVFMLQGWTDWEVYDPQIEGTLHREAVLQGLVAMRQGRMQEEGKKVPRPRLEDAGTREPEKAPGAESAEADSPGPRPDAASAPSTPSTRTRKRRWRFW